MSARTFYITTLGCPKNQADSRAMHRSMLAAGLVPSESAEGCDFHIVNSCAFTQSAKEETIETVLEAGQVKKDSAEQKLVLAGCFAERYGTAVRDEMPEVDFSFGTGLYERAGRLVKDHFALPDSVITPDGRNIGSAASIAERMFAEGNRPYAPVKVSDGCNRGCAFCAIPLFRGRFRDRPMDEIIAECRDIAGKGVREVNLVSQDTNMYGGSPEKLLELAERLQEIPELAWIRILYLYPDARTEKLIRGMGRLEKVVPYLESPVQHTAPGVLKAMRRAGSHESFRDLFALARERIKDVEIRTTFLLGFPGETPADVDLLLKFMNETRPEKLALFTYSPEEGTPGFDLEATVSEREAAERFNLVRDEHLRILGEIHAERMDRVYPCMIDEVKGDGVVGRRPQDAPEADEVVFIEGFDGQAASDRPTFAAPAPRVNGKEVKPGDILDVRITGFFEYDMSAVPAHDREIIE